MSRLLGAGKRYIRLLIIELAHGRHVVSSATGSGHMVGESLEVRKLLLRNKTTNTEKRCCIVTEELMRLYHKKVKSK